MPFELRDVSAIASEIGPRPAGSPAEAETARYVSRRLTEAGVPNAEIPVSITRDHPGVLPLLFFVTIVSVPIMRLSQAAGLVISIVALIFVVIERDKHPLISAHLPPLRSRNVIGLLPAGQSFLAGEEGEEPAGRVIVTAHLDSGKAAWRWHDAIVELLPQIIAGLAVAMVAVPACQIAHIVTGNLAFWYLSLVPMTALLLAAIVIIQDEFFGAPVNGAIAGASGIAVCLHLAEELAAVRLHHLETWFVFTGGYEKGHAGIEQFLQENHLDPERTSFIVIDAAGAGQLRYTRAEGLIVPHNAAPNLIRIARETARDNPVWNLRPVNLRSIPTDLYPILRKGYRGISLFGATGNGRPPHWHQVDDTIANVQPEALQVASQFVLAMIRRLDQQAAPESPINRSDDDIAPPIPSDEP